MQPQRKKMVLSAKRVLLLVVSQNCATTKDLEERNYQTLVRFRLCLTSIMMQADDDIERNVTSSDVEFLQGEEDIEKSSQLPNFGEVSNVLTEHVD
jgi:hypothetical protein